MKCRKKPILTENNENSTSVVLLQLQLRKSIIFCLGSIEAFYLITYLIVLIYPSILDLPT